MTASSVGLGSNAFLPFTPAAGNVYSLYIEMNPTSSGDPYDWFAPGFASTTSPSNQYFGQYNASPWMLTRVQRNGPDNIANNADDIGDLQTFPGPAVNGYQDHDAPQGVVDVTITLDTTAAQWQSNWYVYNSLIRTEVYATNPTITAVGFGRYFNATGYVDNFTLSIIPEPASAVAAIVLLPFVTCRRRDRGRDRRRFN